MTYRPRLSEEEYNLIKEYRGIQNAAENSGLNVKDLKHGWLKTDKASLFFKNPSYTEPDTEDLTEIDFESIVKKYCKPLKLNPVFKDSDFLFDRTVYTDTHVGMNVNPNGYSLYDGKWDEEEIINTCDQIIEHTLRYQKSDVLVLDDLGDFADGWDGKTVRREHDLPQNMDNQKVFDVGLHFKTRLTDGLFKHYKNIIVNNICNSNHSSAFDYVINQAFKNIANLKYSNVEVNNCRKFISHYEVKDHYFIITHGKDDKNLKFGFKPILDKKQENKIDNYLKQNYIFDPAKPVEFSKGDSHQYIFDNATSDTFSYYNYPALSPSSDWVKTNFQKGKRGFVNFNYRIKGEKSINEKIIY